MYSLYNLNRRQSLTKHFFVNHCISDKHSGVKDLPLLDYAGDFSQLAVLTFFFWWCYAELTVLVWENYHCPVDLPETTGLSWREAIMWCLESVYPRSRTQPDPEPSPQSRQAWAHLWRRAYTRRNRRATAREPAIVRATVDETVESEGMEESPAHCTTAEGKLRQESGDLIDLMDMFYHVFFPQVLHDLVFPHVWLCHYVQVSLVNYCH